MDSNNRLAWAIAIISAAIVVTYIVQPPVEVRVSDSAKMCEVVE